MGSINIDNTGSGGDITLSSDGTSLLLGGTAVGGSPDLYAANPSSATDPTASGANALAIGDNATASNTDAIAIGSDATASNTETVAIGHNAIATNNLSVAIGHDTKTTGIAGVSLHVLSTNYGATGVYSMALGYFSKASNYGSIAIGSSATSQAQYAVAIGDGAAVYGTGATYAYALGRSVDVRGENAFGLGKSTQIPTTKGKYAYSAGGGYSAQTGTFVLRSDTTNATAEALTTNNSAAAADNQITLPDNSAYSFLGTIVAREKASEGTECAAWKVEGLIRREGSAGTTVLVNSATTVLDNTPNWGMSLSADTTNGGLAITVTGAASTNIYWAGTINTTEVTYA